VPLTILDALDDPKLFEPLFKPRESWAAWRVALKALFALPMDARELALFEQHTGRQRAPTVPAREGWFVCGRRAGKSRIAALVAVFLACFKSYDDVLAPGETGTVMLLASDRRQARVLMRYVIGMLEAVPMLRTLVVNRTAESVELANRIVVEIHTASFRAVRGYSVVAAICDELAFWRSDESANPDTEIVAALRPAMATIPGALLLAISSPYAKKGALWSAHKDHYGHDGDPVMVWRAPSLTMHPGLDATIVERALLEDESAARAEWLAEFRSDLESYVDPATIQRLIVPGRRELGPSWTTKYFAFCDPSGGSGTDSMTLAISHWDHVAGKAVLDLVEEVRPPFDPEETVAHFAKTLERYRVRVAVGDKFGGDWPSSVFKRHGVSYRASERTKSQIYAETLPLLNSSCVELLDDARLLRQLSALERRTGSSGRDLIDHGPGRRDDVVNAALGSVLLAAGGRRRGMAPPSLLGQIRVLPGDAPYEPARRPVPTLPMPRDDVWSRGF